MTINWDFMHDQMMRSLQEEEDRKFLRNLMISGIKPENKIAKIYVMALKFGYELYDEWEDGVYKIGAFKQGDQETIQFCFPSGELVIW